MVTTVIYIPSILWTTLYRTFITLTIDIIQPYLATSLTKVGGAWSTGRVRIIKRTTNDSCIIQIPWIVTNCSPCTIVEHLNPTLSVPVSSNNPRTWERITCCKRLIFFYAKVVLNYTNERGSHGFELVRICYGCLRQLIRIKIYFIVILNWTNEWRIFTVTTVMYSKVKFHLR